MFFQSPNRPFVAICISVLCASTAFADKPSKPVGGGGSGKGGGPAFSIVSLDDVGGLIANGRANDVNDLRQVVGSVSSNGSNAATIWTITQTNGSHQSTLALLAGGESANSINDDGEIVGTTKDQAGNLTGLYWPSASADPIALPTPPGFDESSAASISNSGIICGKVGLAGEGWDADRAVVWRVLFESGVPVVGLPVELPGPVDGSRATGVNDNDEMGLAQVVGIYEATQTAVLWDVLSVPDGSVIVAPAAEVLDFGAQAADVNNSGVACGQRGVEAVVWSSGSPTVLDRPAKGKQSVPRAAAWAISDTGTIVGAAGDLTNSRACYWDTSSGSLRFLDSYLSSNSSLGGLSSANGVNEHGVIVGDGWYGAFIAIPN